MTKKIIMEQAFAVPSSDIKILEESVLPGGQYKMVFRAKLQEADVVNNNKRVYPAETLKVIYEQLKDKAAERKLVGELDHPQPQGDAQAKIKRSSTISLERACIVIRELEFDGQAIYGVCETLSNRFGTDLYCLLKDKVTIGFSLRAFGEVRNKGGGIVEVVPNGLKALTYDVVANPSHDTSVIIDILEEGENLVDVIRGLEHAIIEESKILEDNKTLLEETSLTAQISEGLSQKVCLGNLCVIAPLEEAVTYLLEQAVSNNMPKIKVKEI